ncbi:hypothetical protein AQPW35_34280 [Rubrivivax pictus]|uniref:Tat pathway signal protein n=2 Tax=Pseudaquabacterium pictum TaxID=2315236 RepID=A0A480AW65_9BURK|nr:hypothetical protein AQPW35_34280 [Rubrivivax pictus]
MMRNTSRRTGLFRAALAATGAMAAMALATPPERGASATSASESIQAKRVADMQGNSRQAAAIERAAWLRAGRGTWRPPGYPRPGDSVRQHARKAAARRNKVRARRAARG